MPALVLSILLCAGCTLSPGGWLSEILPGTLRARLASSAERLREDGWLVTGDGYAVQIEQMLLDVSDLTVEGSAPPDLASPRALLSLRIGESVPVSVRGAQVGSVGLPACRPRCGVERGRITAASATLGRVRLSGSVRDESGAARLAGPTPLSIDLVLGGDAVRLSQPLDVALERGAPERLSLSVMIAIAGAICDGVDWAGLPRRNGQLCLDSASVCQRALAAERIRENLGRSALLTEIADAGSE